MEENKATPYDSAYYHGSIAAKDKDIDRRRMKYGT